LDNNEKECYKCKYKTINNNTKIIYDSKDEPLVSMKKGITSTNILSEKIDKQELVKIKYKFNKSS